MKHALPGFDQLYQDRLRQFLQRRDEASLTAAYELGRQALGQQASLLDLVLAHERALLHILPPMNACQQEDFQAANQFLREMLSAFELALCGYEETNQTLQSLNRQLRQQMGEIEKKRDLEATVTRLAELDRLKSEFIAMASHELRTPLAIMKGYLQLLMINDELKLDVAKQREMMEKVLHQTDRLHRIVDDLLSVSRIESGQVVVTRQPVPLEALAADVLHAMRSLAQSKQIDLQLRVSGQQLPSIVSDRELIARILYNLLENAIKYSPPGSTVRLEMAPVASGVRLAVIDHGVGIPPDQLPRIFDRLYRVSSPQTLQERGMGLGLYLSKQYAEILDGLLVVCSEPENGSTFALLLYTDGTVPRA